MAAGSIELINVTKEYATGRSHKKCALDNITLTINQGEFVGLVGMNGSGKSTLARLINGLILPTAGKVFVNGIDTADRKSIIEIRRHVGMVFQNPDNQIVSPIVEEDVAFGPENLGCYADEVKERIDWALQATGMDELRHHAPYLLSGGQKQKVAIAAALSMRPDYLILDEPTSMLDPGGKYDLIENLKMLNEKYGITVMLISHHMEDVVHADRLIVLDQGQIYLEGTPREVFSSKNFSSAGFKPPGIVQLVSNLRKRGHMIDENIITVQQMVEYICRL